MICAQGFPVLLIVCFVKEEGEKHSNLLGWKGDGNQCLQIYSVLKVFNELKEKVSCQGL